MSQEITLQQAVERAHQIEVICALAEDYPGMMTDSESGAIIGLLKRLSGEVCVFLIDEQERRTLISNEKNAEGYMCNKTTPDAAEEAMQILIRALVDVTHMVESMERKSQSEHDKRKLKTIKIIAKNSLIKVTDILNEDIKRIREKICDA
ncbi:hypothetical protein ACU6DC_004740 [Escherichia coli]